jgi:hypothetical protein
LVGDLLFVAIALSVLYDAVIAIASKLPESTDVATHTLGITAHLFVTDE